MMHGVQKKRALAYETDPEVARIFNCMSKAALLDCVADLLREHCASIDDPVTESVARERLERVLVRRGDKWPVIRQFRTKGQTMASENVAQQAVEGLDVAKSGGIVVVRDSEDIWVCSEAAWDAALVKLSAAPCDAPCVDDEAGTGVATAREHLFAAVAAPVLSLNGTSRGAYLALVDLAQLAIAAGLLDVYLARRALARIRT